MLSGNQSAAHDFIINSHALVGRKKSRKDFVEFVVEHLGKKAYNNKRTVTLYNSKTMWAKSRFRFSAVNLEWLQSFERFLLQPVGGQFFPYPV